MPSPVSLTESKKMKSFLSSKNKINKNKKTNSLLLLAGFSFSDLLYC